MKIDILTLFPQMFAPLKESIIKRAVDKKLLEINVVDIREFSKDKHKKCDDYPFGGGAGMLMQVEPLYYAIKSVQSGNSKLIFPSPQGKVFNQNMAKELSEEEHLVFICGHYEGVDERIFELFNIEEISLGDFVLTGGELPSMVMVDAISRLVDGVISRESLESESFSNNLLEYPQYTRPSSFMGLDVPEVLLSGNHQEIEKWRNEQSLKRTKERRKDLLKKKK
mgnify:FL=1